jgi:hypothetical protein
MLVETTLNFLQNMFMFPTGTPAFLSCGALILENTDWAGVGPVAAQGQPSFLIARSQPTYGAAWSRAPTFFSSKGR